MTPKKIKYPKIKYTNTHPELGPYNKIDSNEHTDGFDGENR